MQKKQAQIQSLIKPKEAIEPDHSFFGSLLDRGEKLLLTKLSLLELKAIQQGAKLFAWTLQIICLGILATGTFLLLNSALAIWIGERIGARYLGFFILAASYFFLALVLTLFRKRILQRPIADAIVMGLQKKWGKTDE